MTQTLNNEAPPAPTATSKDFLSFPAFPASDSYVLTLVAFHYIASYLFERTDDSGKPFTKEAPAVEFFWGTEIDGKAYFVKSWPTAYSLHEKANYTKIYKAVTGNMPTAKQRPNDMLGKAALVEIKTEKKTSKKGKDYVATKIGSISSVPKVLANTAIPLDALKAKFDAALKASDQKADSKEGGNEPF